jgi:hypothetical protein
MKIFSKLTDILFQKKPLIIPGKQILSKEEIQSFQQEFTPVYALSPLIILDPVERAIVNEIKGELKQRNLNNVTRTIAYYEYYKRNPEIHWAFLAHMVSRNGGYYMTDLKSSFLDDLIPSPLKADYFLFLEQCNAYIFQDAYPQLRLYEYSKKQGKDYSRLLNAFHVSPFMQYIWSSFLSNQSSPLITIAMIINEQNMLESRIIRGKYQSKSVIQQLPFQLQENVGFTSVLFPIRAKKSTHHRLYGITVQHFNQVNERIHTGKKLYQILFSNKKNLEGIEDVARKKEHSGSRSDYWNWLFSDQHDKKRRLYSPKLLDAWENVQHSFHEKQDWFKGESSSESIGLLSTLPEVTDFDLTEQVFMQYSFLSTIDSLSHELFKED